MDKIPVCLQDLRSIRDMMSLKGKTAVVTGAAGGIGRSTASALAEMGANVALMDIPEKLPLLDEIAGFIRERHGSKAMTVTGNVADEVSVRSFYDAIVRDFGTVDIVHNNAGVATPDDNTDMDLSVWKRMLDINYTGMLIVAREAARVMKAHKHGGSIIFTSSMSGHIINRRPADVRYSITYTSTKAAVMQLAKAMAMDYVGDDIRVNSISPGYVLSGLHDNTPDDKVEYMASQIPMQRFGTLNEIIGAVVYLASDLGSYHTGSDILIDGGYCVW